MFLSNRLTERNAMKNKEKLKQRIISPKRPPSQPAEHLCVLFSAKNDAVGCQCLPVAFPRVSLLLHPSFATARERKGEKKKAKFQMSAQNPPLIFFFLAQMPTVSLSVTHTARVCVTRFIYSSHYYLYSKLAALIRVSWLSIAPCYLAWHHGPLALVGALVLDHRTYIKNNTLKY